ncbi:hypothetical protein AB0J81_34465 [Streptomyces bobili]|uniref:hypothetical protein n=1 Tax=Streptomyces bobili TaxID=67280 RepID=UPI00343738CC
MGDQLRFEVCEHLLEDLDATRAPRQRDEDDSALPAVRGEVDAGIAGGRGRQTDPKASRRDPFPAVRARTVCLLPVGRGEFGPSDPPCTSGESPSFVHGSDLQQIRQPLDFPGVTTLAEDPAVGTASVSSTPLNPEAVAVNLPTAHTAADTRRQTGF